MTEAVLGLPAAADRMWRRAKTLAYAAAFATVQGDFENVRGLNHAHRHLSRACRCQGRYRAAERASGRGAVTGQLGRRADVA